MFKSTMLVAMAVCASVVLGFGMNESDATPESGTKQPRSLMQLAKLAIDEDPTIAGEAIAELRAAGQEGLDALFTMHPELVLDATDFTRHDEPDLERWRTAVDAVARQHDAAFSRLYWHTDLDEAKSVAKETNKPILSLRLLGRLDEDRSCANSRYFRTLLYPDPEVSKELREQYVLHWESVRPAPLITVDLGDGRRIERTITGNSVHYVLNASGEVLDVLPGLLSPQAFLAILQSSRPDALRNDSDATLRGLLDLKILTDVESAVADLRSAVQPRAIDAGRLARSKLMLEQPLVNEVNRNRPRLMNGVRDVADNEADAVEESLEPLRTRGNAVTISEWSERLMWQKRFGDAADPLDVEQDRAMSAMLEAFRRTVGADTVLNRDVLRPRALEWLADPALRGDVDRLNERVYAELFLTPLDDPWMGLVPNDAYAGLAHEGLIEE